MAISEIPSPGGYGALHFRFIWHALNQSVTLTGEYLPHGELDAGSEIQFQIRISAFIQVLKLQ